MKPTLWMPSGSWPIDDLDAPAYTRGLTPLSEIQRREALRAAEREDASNRSFNRQFRSILASEAGRRAERHRHGAAGAGGLGNPREEAGR